MGRNRTLSLSLSLLTEKGREQKEREKDDDECPFFPKEKNQQESRDEKLMERGE